MLVGVLLTLNLKAQEYDNNELGNLRIFLIQKSNAPEINNMPYNYYALIKKTEGNSLYDGYFNDLKSDENWKSTVENPNPAWVVSIKDYITFSASSPKKITAINWINSGTYPVSGLAGKFDLSACTKLQTFTFQQIANNVTEIIIDGSSLTGVVDVLGNSGSYSKLENFEILNVPKIDGISYLDIPRLECRYNKLKFNKMPQVQVFNGLTNLYNCSSQADSINNAGNEIDSPINLNRDYYNDDLVFDSFYTGTKYEWKKESDNTPILMPGNYTTDDKGNFTFTNESLVGEEIYCEMTNPFFGIPEDGGAAYLILRYRTKLLAKGTNTSISTQDKDTDYISGYFTKDVLCIKNTGIKLQAIAVFNLSGKQLYFDHCNDNEVSINTSGWEKGIYIVKAITANRSSICKVTK